MPKKIQFSDSKHIRTATLPHHYYIVNDLFVCIDEHCYVGRSLCEVGFLYFLHFLRVFLSQIEWTHKKKLKENKSQQTDWLHEVDVCHSQNFNRHRYVSKNTHCGWRHEWNGQRKQISYEWRQRPINIVCDEPNESKMLFSFWSLWERNSSSLLFTRLLFSLFHSLATRSLALQHLFSIINKKKSASRYTQATISNLARSKLKLSTNKEKNNQKKLKIKKRE